MGRRVRRFVRRVERAIRGVGDVALDTVTGGAISRKEQAKREEEFQKEQQRLIDQQRREQEAEEQWQKEQQQIAGAIQGTQQRNAFGTGSSYDFANALSTELEDDEDDILKKAMRKR